MIIMVNGLAGPWYHLQNDMIQRWVLHVHASQGMMELT